MKGYYVSGGSYTRIYVEEAGNPHGIPLFFIHGISQSRFSWRKQVHSTLSVDFRLITMDLRGHGYSEKPRFGYDHSQNWANDIQAVIQSLDLIRPILIGWSYGGPIVCEYLRHYGEDFISGVHFVDAGTLAGTKEANRFFSPERHMIHKGFISNDAETCSKSLADFVRLLFYKPPSVEDYYFILGYNTIVPPYVRQEMSRRIIENDRLLSQMRKPVLITHGMEDRVIFYTLALRNAQFISHARTSFYSQTGHSPFWENPDRFNSELRYFAMEAYR